METMETVGAGLLFTHFSRLPKLFKSKWVTEKLLLSSLCVFLVLSMEQLKHTISCQLAVVGV